MAVDMFLELDDVKGEAQDDKHGDKIDVLAWTWGVANSTSTHVGGGGGTGKADHHDLTVTKYLDKATPTLMQAASSGKHYDKAVLYVRKAGGDSAVEYVTMTMEEVVISGIHTGGSGGEDRLTETVTLNFAKVKLDYQPQDAKGAKAGGKVSYGWHISKNVKV